MISTALGGTSEDLHFLKLLAAFCWGKGCVHCGGATRRGAHEGHFVRGVPKMPITTRPSRAATRVFSNQFGHQLAIIYQKWTCGLLHVTIPSTPRLSLVYADAYGFHYTRSQLRLCLRLQRASCKHVLDSHQT